MKAGLCRTELHDDVSSLPSNPFCAAKTKHINIALKQLVRISFLDPFNYRTCLAAKYAPGRLLAVPLIQKNRVYESVNKKYSQFRSDNDKLY
jgi:hypothetical protein